MSGEPNESQKKWSHIRLPIGVNQFHVTFTLSPNPPPPPPLNQITNNCPDNCPMFRRDKGCISTFCVQKRIALEAAPVKLGEKPDA